MAIDKRALDSIALSRDEYELIVSRLGREPNEVELGMFGALNCLRHLEFDTIRRW